MHIYKKVEKGDEMTRLTNRQTDRMKSNQAERNYKYDVN